MILPQEKSTHPGMHDASGRAELDRVTGCAHHAAAPATARTRNDPTKHARLDGDPVTVFGAKDRSAQKQTRGVLSSAFFRGGQGKVGGGRVGDATPRVVLN